MYQLSGEGMKAKPRNSSTLHTSTLEKGEASVQRHSACFQRSRKAYQRTLTQNSLVGVTIVFVYMQHCFSLTCYDSWPPEPQNTKRCG